MHRTSIAAMRNSLRARSNGDATESGTLQSGGVSDVLRRRSKSAREWNRTTLEVLDPTETDITDTTSVGRNEGIVEEANLLTSPSSSQLLIEDMIHRLREANSNEIELAFMPPSISNERTENRMTIAEMILLLKKANLSVNESSESVSLDVLGSLNQCEHRHWDSNASPGPACLTQTASSSATMDHFVESSEQRKKTSLDAVAGHCSQIPLSELIDRLRRVNKEITSEPKLHVTLQRKAKISLSNSEDDLAQILHQVNYRCLTSEGIDTSKTGSDLSDYVRIKRPAIATKSIDSPSHQSIMECQSSNSGSWIEEECGTATSADYIAFGGHGNYIVGDLSSHQLYGDDDDASGCTLHASARSCNSSVTWYEGSDIDEVPFDDDDDVSASLEFGSSEEHFVSGETLLSTYS